MWRWQGVRVKGAVVTSNRGEKWVCSLLVVIIIVCSRSSLTLALHTGTQGHPPTQSTASFLATLESARGRAWRTEKGGWCTRGRGEGGGEGGATKVEEGHAPAKDQ